MKRCGRFPRYHRHVWMKHRYREERWTDPDGTVMVMPAVVVEECVRCHESSGRRWGVDPTTGELVPSILGRPA